MDRRNNRGKMTSKSYQEIDNQNSFNVFQEAESKEQSRNQTTGKINSTSVDMDVSQNVNVHTLEQRITPIRETRRDTSQSKNQNKKSIKQSKKQ